MHALDGGNWQDELLRAAACVALHMGGFSVAMKRLAQLYERGAEKYDARNWEKGIPIARMFDSGIRHLTQLHGGEDDEDHGAAVLFNFLGAVEIDNRVDGEELPASLFDGMSDHWMSHVNDEE